MFYEMCEDTKMCKSETVNSRRTYNKMAKKDDKNHTTIITLLPFFIEMLQYDWL